MKTLVLAPGNDAAKRALGLCESHWHDREDAIPFARVEVQLRLRQKNGALPLQVCRRCASDITNDWWDDVLSVDLLPRHAR